MAINLNDYKKDKANNSLDLSQYKTSTQKESVKKDEIDLSQYKSEGLVKKVQKSLLGFADITSANIFSGVSSTAGGIEEGAGKLMSLASKAGGRVGEGFYKGLGSVVGLFSKKGKDVLYQVGEDFKKLNYDFAEKEKMAGKEINAFLGQSGREAKETILLGNEGYQEKKKKEEEVGQTAYSKAISEGKTVEEAQAISQQATQSFKFRDLTSKDFLVYDLYGSLIENAPMMLATIYTGGAIGASTKAGTIANFLSKTAGATAFSTGLNALRESEGAYSSALEQGLSKEEAIKRSEQVFERNATGNLGLEAIQMALLFAPALKVASPFLKTLATTGKYGVAGGVEALQERMEDSIQEQAGQDFSFEQLYDKLVDRKLSKTDAISFILGVVFQGMGNVFQAGSMGGKKEEVVSQETLEDGLKKQIEMIAEKLPDDGKGGSVEDKVERAIEQTPEEVARIAKEIQGTIRETPTNIEKQAETENLRSYAEESIKNGASANEIALELSKEIGAVEAKALVEEVSKSTVVQETETAMQDIIDKTPADLQEDFNVDQKTFEKDISDIKNNINDIKSKLEKAEDRSNLKKKLKIELSKEQANLAKAEGNFNTKLTEKTQEVREYLANFIKNTPNIKLTEQQQAELVNRTVDRITNPRGTSALSSVRNILRGEYSRLVNPKKEVKPEVKPEPKKEEAKKDNIATIDQVQTKRGAMWTNKAGILAENKTEPKEGDIITFQKKQWKVESILELDSDTKYELIPQTQKEVVKEVVAKKEKATIKEVAEETGILEPNVRRILGVGAKDGEFERVADGVYRIKANGEEVAVIVPADALVALPALVKDGFKSDMVFLDIPYDTPAVKGGNRGVDYNLISVEEFGKLLDSVDAILRDKTSPIIHMFSQAPSGMKAMQKYNDLFIEKGFVPVGRGEYQKTFKDGSPVTSPNGKVAQPEGILVFTQSGELKKELKNIDFKMVRPKGYQTEKPAEMLAQMIEMTTEEGDVVFDPFAGSGVTGAEAVKKGRKTVLIEKDKEVVEKITKPRVEEAVKETKKIEKKTPVKEEVKETESTKLLSMTKRELKPLLVDKLNIEDKGGKSINKVSNVARGITFNQLEIKPDLLAFQKQGMFTDAFILIKDKKVADELFAKVLKKLPNLKPSEKPELPDIEKVIPKETQKAEIQGYVIQGFEPVAIINNGNYQVPVDANKLAVILGAFPDADIYTSGQKSSIVFKEGKELKALLMPLADLPKGNNFQVVSMEQVIPETKKKEEGEKIEDIGEKIGGAKKDLFQKQKEKYLSQLEDKEVAVMKLAEVLPPIDYENLIANGVSQEALGVYTYWRAEIQKKPSSRSWKLRRWIEAVQALRLIGKTMFEKGVRADEVVKKSLDMSPQLRESINLYKELDFIKNPAVRNLSLQTGKTTDGSPIYVLRKGGRDMNSGFGGRWANSFEEVVALAKKTLEQKEAETGEVDQTQFISVFRRSGKYLTAYKKGQKFIEFETFENMQDAINAKKDPEKIDEYLKQVAELANFDKNSFRNETNKVAERSYRTGDITAQEFMDTFGFRGVEFGNWINQKERQDRLNFGYDALKDLAMILEIPDKAISLNGELGFAFGSRGNRGAMAHYEPNKIVINLTKENGSGTIAHEWWHAFDNYLARRNGDKRQYLTDTLKYERQNVRDAFYDLINGIKKSDLYNRSLLADRYKGKFYFTNRTELGARAFEIFTYETLKDKGLQNDYLVNLTNFDLLVEDLQSVYPYAKGEEIQMVKEKMAKIFEEIEVETSPSSAMFSLKDNLKLNKEQFDAQAEIIAIASDMSKGHLTQEEGTAKISEVWNKVQETLTDEQKAILSTEQFFSLKREGIDSTQKENRFSFLEDIKKRWKIDFDVYFVDTILAGIKTDAMKQKSIIEAWGAYSDNSIAIVNNALENTDRHEVVHLTLDNARRIPIMVENGITRDAVLRAQAEEMGKDYDKMTITEKRDIEETVAENFEQYKENKYTPKGLLEKFFILLKKLLSQIKNLVNKDNTIVRDYYDLLDEGIEVDAQMSFFENKGLLQSLIKDGVLDLRGSKLAVNYDEAPTAVRLPVKSVRLKMKKGEDAYLQKVKKQHNDIATKLDTLLANTEKWREELDTTIQKKAEVAEVIGATPEEVRDLARYTKKTPPKGTLTEKGKAVAGELEFANPEEAEKEVRAYLERKTELIETRNRLRTIRRDIALATKEGKTNRLALRDIERRLKARKEYLERKDLHKKIGRNEQMKMIARRGRLLRETQDFLQLSDLKVRDMIGGIGRQRIHTMTEKEFDDFMISFVNKGRDIMETVDARDSVKALIQEMQFSNEDNVRKALKLPTVAKMTKEQAQTFEEVLAQYEFGDKFLTQRQLETIHRTNWGGVKTEREMHEKIFADTGITREDMANVNVQSDIQKFKNWLVLSRSNPMFAWLVDKRIKAKVQQKAEIIAFEKELNPIIRKARSSREKGFKEKIIQAFAPTDEIVFNYIENENKEQYAKDKQMTKEELALAHFLMGRLFEPARQYMTNEYGMKDRDNYITHLRRNIVETFFDAIKQKRGAIAGVKDAVREIFTSQKEEEAVFKILGGKTGEVLAFEKWFKFAMPRTGNLNPTKNVARASLAYANAYFNKKALDALVPEAVALVKVQEQIKGYTEKGLPLDPTVKTFVDQFLNDAKGRKIEFITQQGSTLDSALRLSVAWTAFKYLGFRPVLGLVNFIGEFVGNMRATTTKEKWAGFSRTLQFRKTRRINKAYEYFTGRNPLVEIFDPENGILTKIKDTAMVLFSLASFFNNQFYLRAKMSKTEWDAELIKDDRMVEIVKEVSKWRLTDFYIKSLAENTATGSVFTQFATWAIPIFTTTLSDTQQVIKDVQKNGAKGLTQEHARSLGKTLALMGTLWIIGKTIRNMTDTDDDDRNIWFYITREMNTLVGAFDVVWNLEGRAPMLRDLFNLQKMIIQLFTAEKYKQDGVGYGVGDWKAGVTLEKLVVPSFVKEIGTLIVGEKDKENTKERLIKEAVDKGEAPDAEAMLQLLSPDEWNNVDKTRTEEEHLEYQKKKKGEILALYNLRKNYADSKVAEIVTKEKTNDDKVEKIIEYGKEVGIDKAYQEVKDIYKDRNLCADPKKKTGCIISGVLLKEVQKAKKNLP